MDFAATIKEAVLQARLGEIRMATAVVSDAVLTAAHLKAPLYSEALRLTMDARRELLSVAISDMICSLRYIRETIRCGPSQSAEKTKNE